MVTAECTYGLNGMAFTAILSDQGFQYTSHGYFKLIQEYNITPSMSRRGNPYDNALAENFFSILKTECIHFYNYQRIQLKTKLTPLEKRSQYVA